MCTIYSVHTLHFTASFCTSGWMLSAFRSLNDNKVESNLILKWVCIIGAFINCTLHHEGIVCICVILNVM